MSVYGSNYLSETIYRRQAIVAALLSPIRKRNAYFSFHYDDIFRVYNVRNAFKIYNPQTTLTPTFRDSSLWEKRKLEGDEAIKRLIREGVCGASVVAVLVGTETWSRPWVRYEIARSLVDGKGLMAIHVNDIRHHEYKWTSPYGENPLSYMGLYRSNDDSVRIVVWSAGAWRYYPGFTMPVPLPKYVPTLVVGCPTPLSQFTIVRKFTAHNGSKNIGVWLDAAAKFAGK